jgi:anti-sigma-K factor RskA
MEHQEYQDLLALHALDALDAADARVFEGHLETCAQCRAELIEMKDTAGLLAHAPTPAEPSGELRARILSSVRSSSNEDRKATAAPGPVVHMSDRRQSKVWPMLLRIAAAIAFVALMVGVIVLWRRDVKLRGEVTALSRQLNAQQHELLRDRDMVSRQKEALALLNSPGAKKMELAGSQSSQNARATFVFDKTTGRAVLMTEGLPAAPPDKAYEVWFIPKGHSPMAGKMFTVDAAGHAMVSDQMPLEARENSVIAITLEPKKGSAVPTGAIYLSSPSS